MTREKTIRDFEKENKILKMALRDIDRYTLSFRFAYLHAEFYFNYSVMPEWIDDMRYLAVEKYVADGK